MSPRYFAGHFSYALFLREMKRIDEADLATRKPWR